MAGFLFQRIRTARKRLSQKGTVELAPGRLAGPGWIG